MVPELKGFALLFTSTHRLLQRALEGLDEAQAAAKPADGNSILWIAAHVVATRWAFTRALGGAVDVPWAGQFMRGSDPAAVTDWPSLAQVRAAWDAVHPAFMARLEALTSEQVSAPSKAFGLDDTVLGAVGLAAVHDAYHVGQLGIGRRRAGLDRLVG